MAYSKVHADWKDSPDETTPILAADLEHIEQGITDVETGAASALTTHGALTTTAHGGVVASSDSRLTDSRTPTAHATSHKTGGTDAVKLDELAAPTDVTTLNASTSAHGLLKKLSNVVTQFLDGTGNFSVPPVTTDATLTATDITTNNASTSKHGFVPKLPGGTSTFYRADGAFATPSGGGGGGFAWPASALQAYVDYVNGSDSNDGLSPSTAYKTIQFAYDTLKAYVVANYASPARNDKGVGRITLLPGGHFVGEGLDLATHFPVEIVGTLGGVRNHQVGSSAAYIASGTALTAGSATATEIINISQAADDIGHGFMFRDVAFLVDQTHCTSLTAVIRTVNIDHLVVQNCMCSTEDGTTNISAYFISQESLVNGDNAWARVEENFVSRLALWHGTGVGGNLNRATYRANVVFYGGSLPMFNIDTDFYGNTVSNNNFEGNAIAVQQTSGACLANTFDNNSGEGSGGSGDTTNPYYEFLGGANLNTIIGGICSNSGGGNGIFVRFATSAYNNVVIGPYTVAGTAGFKRQFIDNSTYGNRLIEPRSGVVQKYKTGTAPTISDADYALAPADGTIALTYGSTGPVYKLWARLNGTWKSVALT